jgi:hypothetical protein
VAKGILFELRDTLVALVRELGEEGRSSREIAEEFQRRHASLVSRATPDLVTLALVHQVDGVSKRRAGPSLVPLEMDLFGFKIPQTLAVPNECGRKSGKIRKNRDRLTGDELDACIEDHSRARASDTELLAELLRLKQTIAPYVKPDMTVGEALIIARNAHSEVTKAERSI